MAEDIRAVLPQLHAEHPKQYGLEVAAVAKHDLYLERSLVLIIMVGQVSACYMSNILRVKWKRTLNVKHQRIHRNIFIFEAITLIIITKIISSEFAFFIIEIKMLQ